MNYFDAIVLTRLNKSGNPYPIHVFRRTEDAEAFAELQGIPDAGFVPVRVHSDPGYHVNIYPMGDGTYSVHRRTGADRRGGLLDPFLSFTARKLALWHVTLTPSGDVTETCLSYSKDGCEADRTPPAERDYWLMHHPQAGNCTVHCFAGSAREAGEKASVIVRRAQDPNNVPNGLLRLQEFGDLVIVLEVAGKPPGYDQLLVELKGVHVKVIDVPTESPELFNRQVMWLGDRHGMSNRTVRSVSIATPDGRTFSMYDRGLLNEGCVLNPGVKWRISVRYSTPQLALA